MVIKPMKRYLTSLTIREMQIETTTRTTSYPLGWLLSKNPPEKHKYWGGCGEIGTLVYYW